MHAVGTSRLAANWALAAGLVLTASTWLCACGDDSLERTATTQSAILNGTPSAASTFAAVGAVVIRSWAGDAPAHTTVCTGTLIASDVVLSAAHCRPLGALSASPDAHPAQPPVLPTAAEAAGAFAGDAHHASMPVDAGGPQNEPGPRQRRQPVAKAPLRAHVSFCLAAQVRRGTTTGCTAVSAFIVDPDYRLPDPWAEGLGEAHDLALLVLAAPLEGVAPATPMTEADAIYLQSGAPVDIAGYGRTGSGADGAPGRKHTGTSVLGQVGTVEMVVGPPPTVTRKTFGDSGGPTFVATPSGARLAGITSRICGLEGEVGGTVDSRVDAAAAWLQATMQASCDSGLRPACRGQAADETQDLVPRQP